MGGLKKWFPILNSKEISSVLVIFPEKRKKEEVGSDYKIENCAIYIQQIKLYFYNSHTVWKFESFSTTHTLRKIEIGESRVTKSAIFTNWKGLNFWFHEFLHIFKAEIYLILELLESPKLISRKIWVMENSWNVHIVSWQHCILVLLNKTLCISNCSPLTYLSNSIQALTYLSGCSVSEWNRLLISEE